MFSCSLKEEQAPIIKEEVYKEPAILPLKLVNRDEPKKTYNIPELKECPCCNSKTYGEIYKCVQCGTSICDSCAYYGDSDLSCEGSVLFNEYICEECYEKMNPYEESAEEISLYEMLTSNFDREDD